MIKDGENTGKNFVDSYTFNYAKMRVKKKLKNETNRTAKYVCAIACVFPDHSKDFVVKGECYGKILHERCGDKGFGYDPLFYYEPFGKTFAEVELSKKNEVSHRGVAMKHFLDELKKVLK